MTHRHLQPIAVRLHQDQPIAFQWADRHYRIAEIVDRWTADALVGRGSPAHILSDTDPDVGPLLPVRGEREVVLGHHNGLRPNSASNP